MEPRKKKDSIKNKLGRTNKQYITQTFWQHDRKLNRAWIKMRTGNKFRVNNNDIPYDEKR